MSETNQGRRDFLGKMLAGGIAAGGLLLERRAEAQEGFQIDTASNDLVLESTFSVGNDKMDIPSERRELTPEAKKMITYLTSYETAITQAIQIGPVPDQLRRDLWDRLSPYFPNCGKFSKENFFKLLTVDVPKYLLSFGVFTTLDNNKWATRDGQLLHVDVSYNFFQIRQTEEHTVNLEGQEYKIQLAKVNDLMLEGQDADKKALFAKGIAQTYGQTVVFFQELWERSLKSTQANHAEDYRYFVEQNSDAELQELLASTTGREQDARVVVAAYQRLTRNIFRNGNEQTNGDDMLNRIETHEAGHVIYGAQPNYSVENKPRHIRTTAELSHYEESMVLKQEIMAKIVCLGLARNKNSALSDIFVPENKEDMAERQAGGNIMANLKLREAIAQELVTHATDYGIVLDDKSPVSKRNQAIFQLAGITADSEKMKKLFTSLYARINLDHDLSKINLKDQASPSEYGPIVNSKGGVHPQKTEVITTERGGNGCGVALGLGSTIVLGAGAWALKKLADRKVAIKAEEEALAKKKIAESTKGRKKKK